MEINRRLRSLKTRYLASDLISVTLFLSIGVIHHGGNPVTDPAGFALTLTPFLTGWLLASPVTEIYRIQPDIKLRDILIRTTGTWILAAVIGLLLRSTSYLPGNSPPIFMAVVLVFGAVFVNTWRVSLYLILNKVNA